VLNEDISSSIALIKNKDAILQYDKEQKINVIIPK